MCKYSIPYYNYLSFANNKTYFVDSSHLNDNGARAYTEIVATDIKSKLKTRCLTPIAFMKVLLANKFYYRRGGDCVCTLNLEQLLKDHNQ